MTPLPQVTEHCEEKKRLSSSLLKQVLWTLGSTTYPVLMYKVGQIKDTSSLYLRPGSHSPKTKTTTLPLATLPPNGRLCTSVTACVRRQGSIECCDTLNWSVLIAASTWLGALQAQKHGDILAKVSCLIGKRAAKQTREEVKWMFLWLTTSLTKKRLAKWNKLQYLTRKPNQP